MTRRLQEAIGLLQRGHLENAINKQNNAASVRREQIRIISIIKTCTFLS